MTQILNSYGYVEGRPTRKVDPDGLWCRNYELPETGREVILRDIKQPGYLYILVLEGPFANAQVRCEFRWTELLTYGVFRWKQKYRDCGFNLCWLIPIRTSHRKIGPRYDKTLLRSYPEAVDHQVVVYYTATIYTDYLTLKRECIDKARGKIPKEWEWYPDYDKNRGAE